MQLRPRYSLLTLLVLNGTRRRRVKLWYGPHRVVVSDSMTVEEHLCSVIWPSAILCKMFLRLSFTNTNTSINGAAGNIFIFAVAQPIHDLHLFIRQAIPSSFF